MRISDWRSDVCSSDLARPASAPAAADTAPGLPRQLAGNIGEDVPAGEARCQGAQPGAALHLVDHHAPLQALVDALPVPLQRGVEARLPGQATLAPPQLVDLLQPPQVLEIGSASGRERVCPYGEI